jgi:hypothetical protein
MQQKRLMGLQMIGFSLQAVSSMLLSHIQYSKLMVNVELDKLLRFIARHQTSMISSPIPPAGHIPPPFLATLVELEAAATKTIAADKSATKKMAPVKAKAVNGIRQTSKKKAKEFELLLKTYNEVSPADWYDR